MNGEQIYRNFTEGDARRLQLAADRVNEISAKYDDRAKDIKSLQDHMEQYWEGDGSAKANAGAGLLAQAFIETSGPLDKTNSSLQGQTEAFDHSKANVVEVPPAPEKPNPWTTGLKAAVPVAGPFMAADDINSYQDGMRAHNEAAQRNVDVMNQYSAVTNSTQGALPSNFGVLAGDGSAISIGTRSTGSISGEQVAAPDSTRASTAGVPVTGPVTSGGPVSGPPNVGSPVSSGAVPPGPSGGGPSGPVTSPPPVGQGTPTNTSGTPVGGITPTNRGGGDQTRTPSRRPSTTAGFGRSTGGRNLAGERLRGVPDPKGGSAKGGVPGRGAVGEGAGGRAAAEGGARGAGSLGAGKGSGVGAPGGAAAAEAGAKNAAATGRGAGTAGAPMGAAGRGNKGEDDQEHKRAEYLQENDPDDVFIGKLGKTTPPVIGQ